MINLDKLEELEKKATPGPWEVSPYSDHDIMTPAEPPYGTVLTVGSDNTNFIVEIRNYLPEIIAELRAAREVVRLSRSLERFIPCDECPISTGTDLYELHVALNGYDKAANK